MDKREMVEGPTNGGLRPTIRSIALALVFVSPGFLIRTLLKLSVDNEVSVLAASLLNFGLAALGAFVFFPKLIKQPFGDVPLKEYRKRLGLYFPMKTWKHIILGVLLALCTLGGMLAASLLTGRYMLDWNTVNLEHLVFSLNPGIWEEFYFRGIIMAVLIQRTKNVRHAALIQIVLFGLTHIKKLDFWSWVDVLSVMIMAAAFVYVAYKTRTLVSGILFHFTHDWLLNLVQVPGRVFIGLRENLTFFLLLWVMLAVACLLTKFASERLGVQAESKLYVSDASQASASAI
jgi:membrane protease YdiL (CAAX protease family)